MQKLEAPDTHHLSAAIGWLELGNRTESEDELNQISADFQSHPDVLEVRWEIYAKAQNWDTALRVAQSLIELTPERPAAWIHQAYALRRSTEGGLEAAWRSLRPAVEKFPNEPIIPYNLACYASQMGRLDEAMDWLRRAMEIAGKVAPIKNMALADSDLEPLWKRIGEL